MRFVLTIDLGNDAMRTGDDVADALTDIAQYMTDEYADEAPLVMSTRIKDRNGNTVGAAEVEA
jgi:hypothetical protein